jgi:hypothetical protein
MSGFSKVLRLYIGSCEAERKDAVQTVAVCDYKQQVITGRLDQIAFAARLGFIEQRLCIVDDTVGFRQYSAQGFV